MAREKTRREAADKLRAQMDAAKYKASGTRFGPGILLIPG
jgi:hypothetical protein